MDFDRLRKLYRAELSDALFDRLGTFINRETGIKMSGDKKVMVQARLKRRLKALDLIDFESYVDLLFGPEGMRTEVVHVFDAISTNKTEFFREADHFDFLVNKVLPEYGAANSDKVLRIWSAACSTGEEVYTLGMVIQEYLRKHGAFDFRILGTDLSSFVLALARNAVYSEERVRSAVPEFMIRRYFMASRDPERQTFRVVPELRAKMCFERLNFMDDRYSVEQSYDVVFCRNVLIYFSREVQQAVVQKLCRHLKPGGYFFHGHSESLLGMDLPLKQVCSTVFKRL